LLRLIPAKTGVFLRIVKTMSRRPVGSPSLLFGLDSCQRRAGLALETRRVQRTGPGLHTRSHYDFENGLLGFALLRLSLSRLLALTLIVGLLTLRIGLNVEAIETQAMLGERAA
jgi:hypothetical protein